MGSRKYPVIGGRRMRVTLEDLCGIPAWGNAVYAVSKGFVSVAATPNYNDGTEITVTEADGSFGVRRPAKPEQLDWTVGIVFSKVDPAIYCGITGATPILDRETGDVKGFTRPLHKPGDIRFGLEVWSDAFDDNDCDDDGDLPFALFGWPSLTGGKYTEYTIENNAVTFGIAEARTKGGDGWGIGPYLIDTDDAGDPAALETALTSSDHDFVLLTTIEPPEVTNGFLPLDDPDGAAATSATAGIPGTWNGVRPATLAATNAGSYASPSGVTAWSAGQFVYVGDGTKIHWAGSGAAPKWVTGAA